MGVANPKAYMSKGPSTYYTSGVGGLNKKYNQGMSPAAGHLVGSKGHTSFSGKM